MSFRCNQINSSPKTLFASIPQGSQPETCDVKKFPQTFFLRFCFCTEILVGFHARNATMRNHLRNSSYVSCWPSFDYEKWKSQLSEIHLPKTFRWGSCCFGPTNSDNFKSPKKRFVIFSRFFWTHLSAQQPPWFLSSRSHWSSFYFESCRRDFLTFSNEPAKRWDEKARIIKWKSFFFKLQ